MTTMIAVLTVRDDGAAEMAKEALEAHDIVVELRALAPVLYLGSATPHEIEVRVPQERLRDAEEILDEVHAELARAAVHEAQGSDDLDHDALTTLPPPDQRPRKTSWAVALALLSPIPGLPLGLMYARAPRALSMTLLGLGVGLFVLGAVGHQPQLMQAVLLVGRLVDAVLAPIFASRFNKRLQRLDARS